MQTGIMYVADEVIDKFKRIEGLDNSPKTILEALTMEIKNEILDKFKEYLQIEINEVVRKEYERNYQDIKEPKFQEIKKREDINPFKTSLFKEN